MAISKIRKGRNEGKYRVRIQPVDPVTGKVISIPSQIASNKEEAKKVERLMWGKYEREDVNPDCNNNFATSLQDFCDGEEKSGRWSYPTYKDWSYTCKLVSSFFGNTKIKDVKENLIRDFARNYIKVHKATVARNSTVDRRLQHLRQYFEYLKEQGQVKVNPVPKNALHKFFRFDEFTVHEQKYIFTDEEVNNIKSRIFKEMLTLPTSFWVSRIGLLIIFDTGMRPQEVQVVKWSQLKQDGDFKVFEINDSWSEKKHCLNHHLKGRARGFKRKTLPLSNEVYEMLKTFHKRQITFLNANIEINKNDYLLLNLRDSRLTSLGMPIGQAAMNIIIKRVVKEVNVNCGDKQISCYNCRHTVASKWANTPGIALSFLASRLGHSVQQLLKTYVHEDSDRSQSMMAIMQQNEKENKTLKRA